MLDNKLLRTAIHTVADALKARGFILDIPAFQHLEETRRKMQISIQKWQHERNTHSKEIGYAKAAGKEISSFMLETLKTLGDSIKKTEEAFVDLQDQLDYFLLSIPNLPHTSVPIGPDADANQVIRFWGTPPVFDFNARDHVELGARNAWMDFETAAALSGSRFVVLRGPIARLQRALVQFMLNLHITQHGYQEISVPYIVNSDSLLGVGQLPKFKEDVFAIVGDHERYLISTAEVPVTNTVRDQVLDSRVLPIKYVCHSACFRSEAGSYGRDIRGMLRQHQFEKVELVQIVLPEHSYVILEELTAHAEKVLQLLELPYRVVSLCTGDLGFAAAKTYDLEVWLPSQNTYREISSCSNTEAFQARRMKARYRDVSSGHSDWVHTLNGSALAVGRTLVAILENYQDAQGRIRIPQVLRSYMDDMEVI